MRHFTVIIPARYASTRFPGKPLAKIGDKTMIRRVYEQARKAAEDVCVATDDERIAAEVESFGGRCVMTSPDHPSGTDRLCEAAALLGLSSDTVVINVQGDEPFVDPDQIRAIMSCFDAPDTLIATLARHFDPRRGFAALDDPNLVKVVFDENSARALYFSRSVIPYVRGAERSQWLDKAVFHTHIGIYAYTVETLRAIAAMPRTSLEIAESLEQLRWLQNGIPITVGISDHPTIGIDTPDDLRAAVEFAKTHNL